MRRYCCCLIITILTHFQQLFPIASSYGSPTLSLCNCYSFTHHPSSWKLVSFHCHLYSTSPYLHKCFIWTNRLSSLHPLQRCAHFLLTNPLQFPTHSCCLLSLLLKVPLSVFNTLSSVISTFLSVSSTILEQCTSFPPGSFPFHLLCHLSLPKHLDSQYSHCCNAVGDEGWNILLLYPSFWALKVGWS